MADDTLNTEPALTWPAAPTLTVEQLRDALSTLPAQMAVVVAGATVGGSIAAVRVLHPQHDESTPAVAVLELRE